MNLNSTQNSFTTKLIPELLEQSDKIELLSQDDSENTTLPTMADVNCKLNTFIRPIRPDPPDDDNSNLAPIP